MLAELDMLERELAYELEEEIEDEGEVSPALEAEYASIGPRDDRFHIPARRQRRPSSLLFPTNTICFLEMTARNGNRFVGSGTLIAPQVVLTAKHCLMDFPAGSGPPRCRVGRAVAPWFSSIQVTPGSGAPQADGRNLVRPAVAQSIVANSTRFRANPNLDYGVIILPMPFRQPGRFMMLQPRGAIRTATLLTIAGYPCDKPRGTMWGHSERIPLRGVRPTHLSYTIDTCPGHSGSPIWLLGNNEIRLLLGVHTSGPTSAAGPGRRCENDPILRRCRPTGAAVTGIIGGYQGHGVKSIIPARAVAKLNFRLVPDQDPHEIEQLFRIHGPNEQFHLPNFYHGIQTCLRFMAAVGGARDLTAELWWERGGCNSPRRHRARKATYDH